MKVEPEEQNTLVEELIHSYKTLLEIAGTAKEIVKRIVEIEQTLGQDYQSFQKWIELGRGRRGCGPTWLRRRATAGW